MTFKNITRIEKHYPENISFFIVGFASRFTEVRPDIAELRLLVNLKI